MSTKETPFKEGYLWFPPQGVLGQLKKSWHRKYCQLFKRSKGGVDRLEIFENSDDVALKTSNQIITLENCIKISQDAQKHQPYVFAIITKSNAYYFSANSEFEMQSWISAFQVVAFKDNISRQTIEEDNDLYCSSGDAGVFAVKLVSSEASERCNLSLGHYTLLVTPVALQLRDADERRTLFTWPYRYIRRYGCRAGKFTFEAGRKCLSGEGVFHFEHSNQQEIFRCISSKMKSMKKLLNSDAPPPPQTQPPTLMRPIDDQFQAALSMSARSRSPLPPSPLLDTELAVKPMMPTPYAPPPSGKESGKEEVAKELPKKPPRKVPEEANSPLAYDDVEVRYEAWRTMGIEAKHTENRSAKLMVACQQPQQRSDSLFAASSPSPTTEYDRMQHTFVPSALSPNLKNYDHLHNIGSIPKQSTAPGYKQIPLASTPTPPPTITSEKSIFACRRPEDFRGYGIIRKRGAGNEGGEECAMGKQEDAVEYAILCKADVV